MTFLKDLEKSQQAVGSEFETQRLHLFSRTLLFKNFVFSKFRLYFTIVSAILPLVIIPNNLPSHCHVTILGDFPENKKFSWYLSILFFKAY